MKEVILSLRPEWWEKMISGEKTLEIRKTFPQKIEFPFTVFVYVCGMGICGEFKCKAHVKSNLYTYLSKGSCVSAKQLHEYGRGKSLHGWHVSDVITYETALPIFLCGLCRPPQSWCYVKEAADA